MVRISLRKEASQAALEHPAEASRKPPDWTYFFRFSRSRAVRTKSPSPVITTKGKRNSSSLSSRTARNRLLVEMLVFCWTVDRNSSLKQREVCVPA